LAQCQFKVTGWVIMFICGIILLKTRLESGPVTADLTTTFELLTADKRR